MPINEASRFTTRRFHAERSVLARRTHTGRGEFELPGAGPFPGAQWFSTESKTQDARLAQHLGIGRFLVAIRMPMMRRKSGALNHVDRPSDVAAPLLSAR